MNAQKLAFFIIAFALAGGIVNESGIFSYDVDVYDIDTENINQSFADGITEINDVSSEGDLQSAFDGWTMIKKTLGLLVMVLEVLFVPGLYLYNLGVDLTFSLAVQAICNLSLGWGIVQFVSGRSTKGMD